MIIAVDFDGTIAEHEFPEIGPPVFMAIEYLQNFKKLGATLILWTMRSDGQSDGDVLTQAVNWCKDRGVEFDFVNENPQSWTTSPKVYAHVYVDDAAFGCPLRDNVRCGGRPYVDWEQVGPIIIRMLKDENNEKE